MAARGHVNGRARAEGVGATRSEATKGFGTYTFMEHEYYEYIEQQAFIEGRN